MERVRHSPGSRCSARSGLPVAAELMVCHGHFAWNAIEGVLGIPVSGHSAPGLFTVEVNGAALLTGGDFGLEGSIVPVVISLLISIPMLIGRYRRIEARNLPVSK